MRGTRRFKIANTHRLRWLLLAVVGLGASGLLVTAYAAGLFRTLENDTIDARFSVRGRQRPLPNLVVVKIDDATFQALNQQWPFPRRIYARLITRIAAEHPAAIAFDVQLTEASSKGLADDEALAAAIQAAHRRTVFGFTETNARGDVRFLGSTEGSKLLAELGARPGSTLFPPDPGGFIRRMQYSVDKLPTLAVVTAEVAENRSIRPKRFPGTSTYIDFPGPAGTIPSVSLSSAYGCSGCGRLPAGFFHNKIVVVGATAPSLQDIHPTSTDALMSGPELQADAIATVIQGFPLRTVGGWINVALVVFLGAAVPLISLRLRPLLMTVAAVGLGLGLVVGVQVAFDSGRIVSLVYPLGALVLGFGGSLSVLLMTEAFERIRTRDLFARFVPENVVDEVLAGAGGLRLGGVQREATVMFCDLRGFTSVAESLEPSRVIEILNQYLSEMSDAILDQGGTLVAYMGDGIFAVFGAPLPQDDHADRAVRTAREMLEVRLPRFNAWLVAEGISDGFKMGIGLNSGHVMSGHVGSERRVEYAAVGDTTNTASRIEGLTKATAHQLLLSDSVRESLREPIDDLEFVMETEIRGRTNKIRLWSIAGSGSRVGS